MTKDDDPARTIQTILKSGRTAQIDWIDDKAPVESIAHTLMAMANSHGGQLLVGIQDGDQPQITGVDKDKDTIDRVIEAALLLDPALIIPLPETETIEDKTVIVAKVPAGMPHVYSVKGRYFHRLGGQNAALKPRDLHQLLIQRGEISFESEITYGAVLDDLDWDKVDAYAKQVSHNGDTKNLLLRRGCLSRLHGNLHPTNAGILLFGKEPQRFVRGAEITAVRFAGNTMSDKFNRHDIIGTLPEQIRKAETFLYDHLRKGVELKSTMARQESYEYPMEAARELVVNAVAHRDYSLDGDGIRLYIFRDHMEISSAGKLPGPVTVDNIKDERFSRNPIIVQILSDMGYIEKLGYGVDRVIELMKKQKLKAPSFNESNAGFKVILFNAHTASTTDTKTEADSTDKDQPEAPATEIRSPLEEYADIPLNPRQEEAIRYLKRPDKTRITNSELQSLFPDVHAETIRRDLADLVTKNIVTKMGQKRGSYYVFKTDDNQT